VSCSAVARSRPPRLTIAQALGHRSLPHRVSLPAVGMRSGVSSPPRSPETPAAHRTIALPPTLPTSAPSAGAPAADAALDIGQALAIEGAELARAFATERDALQAHAGSQTAAIRWLTCRVSSPAPTGCAAGLPHRCQPHPLSRIALCAYGPRHG
jgi:hypothetical protein